jgi:hypothetical protein
MKKYLQPDKKITFRRVDKKGSSIPHSKGLDMRKLLKFLLNHTLSRVNPLTAQQNEEISLFHANTSTRASGLFYLIFKSLI